MTPSRRASDHRPSRRVMVALRRVLPPVAYVLLVIGAFGAAVALEHQDRDRLRAAELAACKRVKIVRAEGNTIAAVAFLAFLDGAQREQRLAKAGGPQAAVHRRSAKTLLATSHAMRWTPQTDCPRAVDHAKEYRPPRPHAFTPRIARRILREAVSAP
jgi:hypothetical protein